MIVLLEHPFGQELLRADPNRLDAAVEETRRWSTLDGLSAYGAPPVRRSPA